jgi:hypothetical protein
VNDSNSSQRNTAQRLLKHRLLGASVLFCAVFLLSLLIGIRLRILAADDSYIHLRVAHHLLLTGHAFFNSGERVMVSSSPLWVLLLALSSSIMHGLPPAAPLEALSMATACALSLLLAAEYARHLNLVRFPLTLYLAIPPILVFILLLQSSIQQMETPAAIALMLAGIYAFERQRSWWAPSLVLAAFTRYELFLLLFILSCAALATRRATWRAALSGFAVLFAGCTWLLYQYGTLIPNTIKAKSIGYLLTRHQSASLLGLTRASEIALIAVAAVLFTRKPARHLLLPNLLIVFGIILTILYIASRTLVFPWYLPLAILPIVLGLSLGIGATGKIWQSLIAIATILLLLPWQSTKQEAAAFLTNTPRRAFRDTGAVRVKTYQLTGRAIAQSCPNARLLTSEIGGLGDGFPGEILDGFGLATPAAIRYHPLRIPDQRSAGAIGAIPPAFASASHPDLIVTYGIFAEALLQNLDPAVFAHYIYPPLPATWLKQYGDLGGMQLHILVAKAGVCSPSRIDTAVSQALQDN